MLMLTHHQSILLSYSTINTDTHNRENSISQTGKHPTRIALMFKHCNIITSKCFILTVYALANCDVISRHLDIITVIDHLFLKENMIDLKGVYQEWVQNQTYANEKDF